MSDAPLLCPHRPACPGCPRFGEPGLDPALAERIAALARAAGLATPPLHEGAPLGFRTRARLMLRGRAGAPKLGLFAEGTHRVVDVPRCPIHHPRVNEAAAALRAEMRALRVPPYSDAAHAGLLRAVQIVVERPTQRVQIVLVANDRTPDATRPLARALAGRLGPVLHSLWWNGNPERTNVILGPLWERLAGEEAVRERIGGADVFFPPAAFGQSQLDLADRLVARVHAHVPFGARVAELYAGSGAIGLGLVPRAERVVFNEEGEGSLAGLALGIAALPEGERARTQVAAGSVAAQLGALDGTDVVIADPPRKGLDPALVDALCARPPGRLLYVSCGLASFERDLAALRARSPLRLVVLEAFALFPYTKHVELLGVLEPRAASLSAIASPARACGARQRAPSSARRRASGRRGPGSRARRAASPPRRSA